MTVFKNLSTMTKKEKTKGKRGQISCDDNNSTPSAGGDPEGGWFRKGEHKNVFVYAIEIACDKNSWILGYTINPGNPPVGNIVFQVIRLGKEKV